MTAPFRLYGAELSPYAVKVRSYLRFKGLDFEWLERSNARQEEFSRYAKLPLAPVLVDADENVLQDSTPMIETLEAKFVEPSITLDDRALAFLAALLEDYADEWLNKAMFHYRWSKDDDRANAARRTVEMLFEGAQAPDGVEAAVQARMTGRLHHAGSSPETAPIIEASFTRVLQLLERLLGGRPYLFGGRPSLADFGLAGQLRQLLSDPTPSALIRAQAPSLAAWVERMDAPRNEGAFASLDALRAPLADLLREEIAAAYLPWMDANARAVSTDALNVHAEIAGGVFTQKPQRYAAKAFAELRRKYALADSEALTALLVETECDVFLQAPPVALGHDAADDDEGDDAGDEAGGEEGEE
jgi:glutathione S-transferase